MSMKRVLGTLLASRMGGRGGGSGALGTAAMLGMLGGRRGGLMGKAGMAGLAYMAYQAYQGRQSSPSSAHGSGSDAGSGGGIVGALGDLANRFIGGGPETRDEELVQGDTALEAKQSAERFSDEKAFLLICAMIAAANADGRISPEERARILHALDESGADSDDRRIVDRELENPKSLDELLREVRDQETAREFYLASCAAVDRQSEPHRTYLLTLRQRLGLSEEEIAEIEGFAS